ncbi:MAG: lipocalin family protein [Hyphomonadaceae bacterium]
MRKLISLLAICAAAACAGQPVNRSSTAPLPVAAVETGAYLGLWHEAARLPNRFERDCVAATAQYDLRPEGALSVRNTCYRAEGGVREVVGRARRTSETEGRLKVSFFGPFWADYWVLARAEDYSWSIVGEPSGRYLWVLTRSASVSQSERADFEDRLRALGYDPAALIWNGA